ncbi:MAG: monovalent cation/H+ antiporter subunit D family protein [Thermodesulfobacteriota bacterium]|nr:monovalent cation/H+ antiporter subunit D family protein [Thermodesulfobacteriota bacterium]
MTPSAHLPIIQVIIPLLAAPLCIIFRSKSVAWSVALCAAWTSFAVSILIAVHVSTIGSLGYDIGGWPAPWGISYYIDYLNAFVLLIVSGICALALPYARLSVAQEIDSQSQPYFYSLLLVCFAGLLGITVTGDAFNMYVFLELSSLSAYALIGMGPRRRALTAAYQYLVMGTIGATFILIGIGLLYSLTGTLNIHDLAHQLRVNDILSSDNRTLLTAFAFLTVGLSLKMALFPLHLWLPNAYTYAPSVVTIFLAATATKVAIYMLLRFCFCIIGNGTILQMTFGKIILIPSLSAIIVASIVAIFQYDIKRMLAYSSIAQIGYMILGLSFATTTGLTAGILHMFNHALMKGLLFMVMGAISYRVGSVYLSDFRGLGKKMPWTMVAFVLGGLSLMGVPLTAGFISKWYLIKAALEIGWWDIVILILLGSLLAVIYIWRVVETAYFNPAQEIEQETGEAPLSLMIPMWILVIANIYFGIDSSIPLNLAHQAAKILMGGL